MTIEEQLAEATAKAEENIAAIATLEGVVELASNDLEAANTEIAALKEGSEAAAADKEASEKLAMEAEEAKIAAQAETAEANEKLAALEAANRNMDDEVALAAAEIAKASAADPIETDSEDGEETKVSERTHADHYAHLATLPQGAARRSYYNSNISNRG